MADTLRPARQRVLARRRRTAILAGAVLVVVLAGVIVLGFVTAYLVDATGNVNVYLFGSGVDKLAEGAVVAMDVLPVGSVREVGPRDGKLAAQLAIRRAYAEQIPQRASRFRVESLNEWTPGNLGVRVYVSEDVAGAQPIRDGDFVEAENQFLPPIIPPKFYLLVFLGLLMIAVVIAIAMVAYKWVSRLVTLIVVVAGILLLVLGYQYFDNKITPPQAPVEWRQALAPD